MNKWEYDPLRRDLLLSRISVLFVIGGSLLTAFAPVPWLFVISLVITSLGVGFSTLCRALLNAIVEPHILATLNTTVSMMETRHVFGQLTGSRMVAEPGDRAWRTMDGTAVSCMQRDGTAFGNTDGGASTSEGICTGLD